jgi:hypothetical protein
MRANWLGLCHTCIVVLSYGDTKLMILLSLLCFVYSLTQVMLTHFTISYAFLANCLGTSGTWIWER